MKWTVSIMTTFATIVLALGLPMSATAAGWNYVPADPPVTLPDLIAKGGQVEAWLAGRATAFIPELEADADFLVGGTLISYERKLYRCLTHNGESMDDGNCFVAVNK